MSVYKTKTLSKNQMKNFNTYKINFNQRFYKSKFIYINYSRDYDNITYSVLTVSHSCISNLKAMKYKMK